MSSFPYFFPDSKFLQKKPWHRIIWLLCTIYSGCSLYSVFATLLILIDRLGLISIHSLEIIITLPMLIPLTPLLFFSTPGNAITTNTSLDNSYLGLLLMVYFFISVFLPSIIYLVLLNGIFGKRWKK